MVSFSAQERQEYGPQAESDPEEWYVYQEKNLKNSKFIKKLILKIWKVFQLNKGKNRGPKQKLILKNGKFFCYFNIAIQNIQTVSM